MNKWKIVKLVKHIGTLVIYNEILRKRNVRLKMQTHKIHLDKGIGNMKLEK